MALWCIETLIAFSALAYGGAGIPSCVVRAHVSANRVCVIHRLNQMSRQRTASIATTVVPTLSPASFL